MEATLTFLQDHPRYKEEKPFRRVAFPNLLMEWQLNYGYVDEEDISVTDIRGNRNNFLSATGRLSIPTAPVYIRT